LEQSRKFAARRLKCDDPRVRNKYIKHYEQYFEKKQLLERSRKLASNAKDLGITQQQAQQYEQLDALQKNSKRSTTTMQEIPYRGKRLVTKNDTTSNQSAFLEASMQGQYGSCDGKKVIEQALNKVLSFDLI
jgi:hypothetical protein